MAVKLLSQGSVVDRWLRRSFRWLGHRIGTTPGYFIIIPILLTAIAASGFQRIRFEADPEYLFSPLDGEGKTERQILEQYFPTNYTNFDPGRVSRHGRFGRVIITAIDNGTVLRKAVYDEIEALNQVIESLTFEHDDQEMQYSDICASQYGQCWTNDILVPLQYSEQVEKGEMKFTFPIWFDPLQFQRIVFPFFTGGVTLNDDHTIAGIEAVALNYFLNSATEEDVVKGSKWEAAFIEVVGAQNFSHIKVDRFSSLTLEVELERNTSSVIPYFSLNILIMVVFCIVTCMMRDWVRSKPFLGLLGVVSAILGTVASFGFVIYCGSDFIGINLAVPFLMLGIGIDDTFVMLGAWRRTDIRDPVAKRMAECFEDAAVSITITSVTDMLSFWIGVITPFPCVKIFCLYTGVAVAFTYAFHITFFGGCMAVSGYAEEQNRHSVTCLPVLPRSQSDKKNFIYRVFCPGGINRDDPYNIRDNKDNAAMSFFRDYVGGALNNKMVKALILILFCVYFGVAIWGTTGLKEGLERKRLARFDSYSVDFYDNEDKYFRDLPYRINVVISGTLDYSDLTVQREIEELLQKLEATTFIDKTYTESWLRDFVDFVERNKEYTPIDISTEDKFIDTLLTTYLGSASSPYLADIEVSEDPRRIIGSRFLIQGANIRDANDEKIFVEELRNICHASKYNVTVFHPYFIYFDQFLLVLPTTLQCVTVAALVMMVVSVIFIPNPICSLWVAFSIISIELGVVGFMTLWDICLDSVSMVNLIFCIGFSVDFSAHISYHFMSRKDMSMEERVRDSMFALGLPITQGAVSTIIGVIGLVIAPSYIFITFFKMVFLVITLGAIHGLFLLPVLLSLFGTGSCKGGKGKGDGTGPAPTTQDPGVVEAEAGVKVKVNPANSKMIKSEKSDSYRLPHFQRKRSYELQKVANENGVSYANNGYVSYKA